MTAVIQAAHRDELGSVARQMGKWIDHVLGHGFRGYCPEDSWSPAINLYEDQTHYCVVADLSGVEAEKIDLRTEGKTLILSGFRPTPGLEEVKGRLRLHHMEIDHGRFCRSLELPQDIDTDGIEASYKTGLLWIHLPKKA